MNARQKHYTLLLAAVCVGSALGTLFDVPINIKSMEEKDGKPIWKLEKGDRVAYERPGGKVLGFAIIYGVMMTIAHFRKDPKEEECGDSRPQ